MYGEGNDDTLNVLTVATETVTLAPSGHKQSYFCILMKSWWQTIVGISSIQQALVINSWPSIIEKCVLSISFLSLHIN